MVIHTLYTIYKHLYNINVKKREKFTGLCINPECRKPIIFKSNVLGKGSIFFDCKHCGTENEVNITIQSVMKMIKPILILIIIFAGLSLYVNSTQAPTTAEVPVEFIE